MDYNSTNYLNLVEGLMSDYSIAEDITSSLMGYVMPIYRSDLEERYSEPMPWIGMYIALASLVCVLAMVADLVHGLRSRKLWFPCKYFTINSASLAVIAVAMKLPVDLSGSMPGDTDQVAKLGSMAFMCTIMANLLPCLATMDNKELRQNVTGLAVQVITLVVNMCIQINTGVVSYKEGAQFLKDMTTNFDLSSLGINKDRNTILATTYVTLLMVLVVIHVCSSLAILKSKEIIESQYQQGHEDASEELQQSSEKMLTVEKLHQHLSNYWIMAESGSPAFIIASFATTTASGVICASTAIVHTLTFSLNISDIFKEKHDSDYKWSTLVILIVQLIGVLLGTIAPLCRCFATLSFKVSSKSILNHMKVFKVQSYWSQMLYDWKHGSIRFRFRSRKPKVAINILRNIFFTVCIELQEGVVVGCKTLSLIPFFFMICVVCCLRFLQLESTENSEQSRYVLKLETETELPQRTLKGLSKSLNRLIKKGENKQPSFLKKLITERSTKAFQGVKKFDTNDNHVPSLLSKVEYQDCWSLPVITLTTIAITLPNNEKVAVDSLLKSVREGLEYVTLVEETLNATYEYVSIRKAVETLWHEVDVSQKWLGEKLQAIASEADTTSASQVERTRQIVQLFLKKAKNKINEGVKNKDIGGPNGDFEYTSICADSMSRITKTIINDKGSQEDLFKELSSWIADIMAACLTNLPQVIAMKCHTNTIEKREACIQATARLLGETKEMIDALQHDHDIPRMNTDDLPFVDKWRAYLSGP